MVLKKPDTQSLTGNKHLSLNPIRVGDIITWIGGNTLIDPVGSKSNADTKYTHRLFLPDNINKGTFVCTFV